MRDRYLLPLMALTAGAMVALALAWPQGEGAPSPAPFGRPLAPIPQEMTYEAMAQKALRGVVTPTQDGLEAAPPAKAP